MKILLAGGTGFIGRELLRQLVKERHSIILLSRNAHINYGYENVFVQTVWWDGKFIDHTKFNNENIDIIINLSGSSLASKRWTKKQKEVILESRIKSTKAIVNFISLLEKKPKMLINASAIGYYGNVENLLIDESYPKGTGFLSDTCYIWEKEANEAKKYNVNVSICRFGIVLGRYGGVLKKIYPFFNNYLGATIGNGNQGFSWIHIEDLTSAILFILNNNISGIVNVVSPNPINAYTFYKTFSKILNKPCFLKIPSIVIKLLLGEMSNTLLEGQFVIPKVLLNNNFEFKYKTIHSALANLFQK